MKIDDWHVRLIMIKNTAYAWRQMVFFLALLPHDGAAAFLQWAEAYLSAQPEAFRNRFRPGPFDGLRLASEGRSLDSDAARASGARRFVGWSKARHWLLSDDGHP